MNKEQQIEEIEQVIYEYVDSKQREKVYLFSSRVDELAKPILHNKGIAEALYNAGYRKIDGDNYVSREWHDEQVLHLESELEMLKSEKENIVHNYAVITKAELKEYKRQAVKEFAEKLKEKCSDYLYDTNFDGKNDFDIHIGELSRMIDELLKEYE